MLSRARRCWTACLFLAPLLLTGCMAPSGSTSGPTPAAIPTIEEGTAGGVHLRRVCFNEVAVLLEGDLPRWVVVELPGLYERIIEKGEEQREFTWDVERDGPPSIDVLIISDNPDPTCSDTSEGLDVGVQWPAVAGTVSVIVERISEPPNSCGDDVAGVRSLIEFEGLRFERPDGQIVAVEDLSVRGDLGFTGPDC